MHISSADKKEKPWFLKALKTRRNPFFDKTVRKTGFIQLQNQARFCKMFSLPHGSRRRIYPDRLLQNRSDTAGRFYSYDILKNCTFARGKQCTICSVVYCKRREYVVLFLIRKMDSIFGVSLKFIAYSILNVFYIA